MTTNDDTAVEIYKTPPDWGSYTTSAQDEPPNPWTKKDWNITHQGRIFKADQAGAARLAQAAGHKDAISARLEHAK
jgi:hypothetical protein